MVQKKRTEWRRHAMRNLRELEMLAEQLRARLEAEPELNLGDLVHESSDLISFATTVVTYVDRDGALLEAGVE